MIDRETDRNFGRTMRREYAPADHRGSGMRRRPTQQRSRQRVRLILDAAAELLDEGGYPALTTTAIAARANVSVGSIYQFFSNVDAIVTELVRDWVAGFEEIMDHLDNLVDVPMAETIDTIIDDYVEFIRKTRGFVAIYFKSGLTGDSRALDRASNDSLADRLAGYWSRRYGVATDDRMIATAKVTIHIGDSLLALAFRRSPAGDDAIIAETKRAARTYVVDALAELGIDQPARTR